MNFEKQLKITLKRFDEFLTQRQLVELNHQEYFLHWVKEFLYFAKDKTDLTFEQSRDFFIREIENRANIESWQINEFISNN